mmetsp:Transcript_35807/g.114053  ORF Transcript_35807/g.114053 Transcript_35807/m.114053 type:complete len:231 (+) Transcript_35807:191-883(+)
MHHIHRRRSGLFIPPRDPKTDGRNATLARPNRLLHSSSSGNSGPSTSTISSSSSSYSTSTSTSTISSSSLVASPPAVSVDPSPAPPSALRRRRSSRIASMSSSARAASSSSVGHSNWAPSWSFLYRNTSSAAVSATLASTSHVASSGSSHPFHLTKYCSPPPGPHRSAITASTSYSPSSAVGGASAASSDASRTAGHPSEPSARMAPHAPTPCRCTPTSNRRSHSESHPP